MTDVTRLAEKKFRPIKTTKITCKQCGHSRMLEVDEMAFNTSLVNYVAKIRLDERQKTLTRAAGVARTHDCEESEGCAKAIAAAIEQLCKK